MKVTTTDILGYESPQETRPTINDNFKVLADAINKISDLLDPDNKTLTNIASLTINSSTSKTGDILLSTNGSISVGGDAIINKGVSALSATIENDLVVSKGSVLINSADASFENNGTTVLTGSVVTGSFIVDCSSTVTFKNASVNNLLVKLSNGSYQKQDATTTGAEVVGGIISPVGMNVLVLDWSSYKGAGSQSPLKVIRLDSRNIPTGQTLRVISKMASSGQKFYIDASTIAYAVGEALKHIVFDQSYYVCDMIFDGTNWIVTSLLGAEKSSI